MIRKVIETVLCLSVVAIFGCGDKGTEPRPPVTTNEIKLAADAYIIEESESFALSQRIDSVFVFNYTGAIPDLTVGRVIVGEGLGGYIGRVTSIDTTADQLTVHTTAASLVEAVEKGGFEETVQLGIEEVDLSGGGGNVPLPGEIIYLAEGLDKAPGGFLLSGMTIFSGQVGGVDLEVSITDGAFCFDPTLNIGGDIEVSELDEFRAVVSGTIYYDCNYSVTVSGATQYSDEIKISTLQQTLCQHISNLPVVEVVTLDIFAGFEIDADGEQDLLTGFEGVYDVEFGAVCRGGAWQPVRERGSQITGAPVTYDQPVTLSFKGYLKAVLTIDIYSEGVSVFECEPFLSYSGEFDAPPAWSWELRAGLSDGSASTVDILDPSVTGGNFSPADWDTLLSTGSSGESPVATISSPADLAIFQQDQVINFTGTAEDPQEGMLNGASIVWVSDKDGPIGTGTAVYAEGLSINIHNITMTATDSEGYAGSDRITIDVRATNYPPEASIDAPLNGQRFLARKSIIFEGSGTDYEDGTLPPDSLEWISDRDGYLGSGPVVSIADLSIGNHLVTLTVKDSDQNEDSESVTIYVDPNNPPAAWITSPPDSMNFSVGEQITFGGSGEDPEDGQLGGGALAWSSDVSGLIGTGTSFSRSDLPVSRHVITLRVTDSDDNTVSAVITIFVNPKPDPGDMTMIDVPATTSFPMGWAGGYPDSEPVHTVSLDSFQIGKHEISFALWLDVKAWGQRNGYVFAHLGGRGSDPTISTARHPVTKINWYDCLAWCNAYSEREGLAPSYYMPGQAHVPANVYRDSSEELEFSSTDVDWTADGFRLPTEAEWEYVARYIDGTNFDRGDMHSGNDINADIDYFAWYSVNSEGSTHPVGALSGNRLGVKDMSGNVWEWCWDCYGSEYYNWSPTNNPKGPEGINLRVLRGGSFYYSSFYCSTSKRYFMAAADWVYHYRGFRVCRGAPSP